VRTKGPGKTCVAVWGYSCGPRELLGVGGPSIVEAGHYKRYHNQLSRFQGTCARSYASMVCMAGVGHDWSHSRAHAPSVDPRTWSREDVPGLGLINEDTDILRVGVCDILAQGLIGLIRILIPISCNFFSGSPSPKTPKLSVLDVEQWVTDREVLLGCA
jgi:hypothetical protein